MVQQQPGLFNIPLKPVKQDSNILADWCRLSQAPIYIDGVSVVKLVQRERKLKKEPEGEAIFPTEQSLRDFFKKHLLKNVAPELRNNALEVLMESLHQGSWQRPVSAASYQMLSEASDRKIDPADIRSNKKGDPAQARATYFKTTPEGFNIKEKVTQYKCTYNINADDLAGESIVRDNKFINRFCYSAQATIVLDFKKNPTREARWPKVTLKDESIKFGNKQIQQLLDKDYEKTQGKGFFARVREIITNIFDRKNRIEPRLLGPR